MGAFMSTFTEPQEPLSLMDYQMSKSREEPDTSVLLTAHLRICGKNVEVRSKGNGPLSAFVQGLSTAILKPQGMAIELTDYESIPRSTTRTNSSSEAVCTVLVQLTDDAGIVGKPQYGVG